MQAFIPFSFLIFLVLLFLFPLLFSQLMVMSFSKLHLAPDTAMNLVLAIILGGLINIPVKRIAGTGEMIVSPLNVYGVPSRWPKLGARPYNDTVIAVNLGGCIIPVLIAAYELMHLSAAGPGALFAVAVATLVNTLVCYRIAQPIAGVGIAIPGFIPPLVAAGLAMLLAPHEAPAVAFVAGVAGPLIGADFLHLKDFVRSGPGVASIGGAGTFDGIVLSGIVAAYLA